VITLSNTDLNTAYTQHVIPCSEVFRYRLLIKVSEPERDLDVSSIIGTCQYFQGYHSMAVYDNKKAILRPLHRSTSISQYSLKNDSVVADFYNPQSFKMASSISV